MSSLNKIASIHQNSIAIKLCERTKTNIFSTWSHLVKEIENVIINTHQPQHHTCVAIGASKRDKTWQ